MNLEQARFNMVEQQIRTWEVLDQAILDLLFVVKREEYVPAAHRALAFADLEIPLGEGQKMWPPKLEARALQELKLRPQDKVLEVGTGSGYLTALLAAKAREVISVEILPTLAQQAQSNLAQHRVNNLKLIEGDAARGWAAEAPYDAIVLTGSTPVLPDDLLSQLKVGGRLFAVVGDAPAMSGRLIVHSQSKHYQKQDLFETVIDPLINAVQPERFVF